MESTSAPELKFGEGEENIKTEVKGKTLETEEALVKELASLTLSGPDAKPSARDCKVALFHDEAMQLHKDYSGHTERPERVTAILSRLKERQVYSRCTRLPAVEAKPEEIMLVHSEDMYKKVKQTGFGAEKDVQHLDADTYANKYSYRAALLAAGCTIESARRVVSGEFQSAFAIVRPPGHHAEADAAMGFCLFNSSAVAAQYARAHLDCARVAILDWDVHHGNGTQHIFEQDPTVLYLSVHKGGSYYPGTGRHGEIGQDAGRGFTVNCPFLLSEMGDKEYLTLFQYVFIPIITEFNPDLLIISAGFDCAAGDLLGPMRVSPKGFAHMMRMCLDAVPNRVIAVLEGGYDLTCTATGAEACIATMLGDPVPLLKDAPLSTGGLADIMKCIDSLKPYWKCLRALQNDRRWRELIAPHAQRLAQYREGAPQ